MSAHLYDDYFRQFPPLPSPIIPNPNQPHRAYIDDLNDTLLELIFTRILQWRHLVTCKCVSKRWNSIISNPYFARYLTRKYSPFTLILSNGCTDDDDLLITEHPYFQRHKLHLNDIFLNNYPSDIYKVAYHNDILVSRYVRDSRFAYNICNPLTKQFIVVPVTPEEPEPGMAAYTYYNNFHSNCKVGFAGVVNGVSTIDVPNPNNNVIGFRIILIDTGYYANELTWQIYSSVTGKWKTYNNVNDLVFEFRSYILGPSNNQGVTSNNRVHWHGHSNKILVIDPFVDDFASYCVLNLPAKISERDSVLGFCQNRLRIAQLEQGVTLTIKVWEFDEDDDSITWGGNTMAKLRLVVNIDLKPHIIARVFPPIEGLFSSCLNLRAEVICCHSNDPDIVYLMYGNKLLECDVDLGRLRMIHHCTTSWYPRYMLVHPLMAP